MGNRSNNSATGVYRGARDTGIVANPVQATINDLTAAYAQVLGTDESNVRVTLDTDFINAGQQARYLIEFAGDLAGTDVRNLGFIFSKGKFSHSIVQQGGGDTQSEYQVNVQGDGYFQLEISQNGTKTRTDGIRVGSNAATVAFAINAVAGNNAASVIRNAEGYRVTFDQGLAGVSLFSAPEGSFTLTLGSQVTDSIEYSSDASVLAGRVQTALRATLGNTVTASINSDASSTNKIAVDVRFSDNEDKAQLQLTGNGLSAVTASVKTLSNYQSLSGQRQQLVLERFADTAGSFQIQAGGQTTSAIDFDASAAQLQTALNNAFAGTYGNVTVSGSLDRRIVEFGNLRRAPTPLN